MMAMMIMPMMMMDDDIFPSIYSCIEGSSSPSMAWEANMTDNADCTNLRFTLGTTPTHYQ